MRSKTGDPRPPSTNCLWRGPNRVHHPAHLPLESIYSILAQEPPVRSLKCSRSFTTICKIRFSSDNPAQPCAENCPASSLSSSKGAAFSRTSFFLPHVGFLTPQHHLMRSRLFELGSNRYSPPIGVAEDSSEDGSFD